MTPIHRKSDICTGHDIYPPRPTIQASEDVIVEKIGACRVGDSYDTHGHMGSCAGGSPNVFVNGRAIVRVGDGVSCGGAAATGSQTVFAN